MISFRGTRIRQNAPRAKRQAAGRQPDRLEWLEGLYERAKTCMANGRWEEALSCLEQVALAEPRYRDTPTLARQAWAQVRLKRAYDQGITCLRAGDHQGALRYLSLVVKEDPGYRDAQRKLQAAQRQARLVELYRRGLGYYTRGRWPEAIETFGMVLSIEAGHPHASALLEDSHCRLRLDTMYASASRMLQEGRWQAAIDILRQIEDLSPGYRDVPDRLQEAKELKSVASLYEQGVQACRQGNWPQAIECLEQVVAVREDYRDAAQLLAEARQEAGLLYMSRRQRAAHVYEPRIDVAEEHEALASAQVDQRQAHACFAEAQRQRQIAQSFSEGQSKLRSGLWLDAIVCFKQVLALDPGNEEAPRLLEKATAERKVEGLAGQAQPSMAAARGPEAAKRQEQINQLMQGRHGAQPGSKETQLPAQPGELPAGVQEPWQSRKDTHSTRGLEAFFVADRGFQDASSHLRQVIAFIE